MSAVSTSGAGSAGGAGGASDSTGLTSKAVVTSLTSSKGTALRLELVHAHGRELAGRVVLSLVVVNLVDGDSGVDDAGLDNILLDNWLDDLVDMVVAVLTSDDGSLGVSVCSLALLAGALELGSLLVKLRLDGSGVAVVVLAVLDRGGPVGVLLGQNLTVLDGLDGRVVVVLVNLTVDGTFGKVSIVFNSTTGPPPSSKHANGCTLKQPGSRAFKLAQDWQKCRPRREYR